MAIGMKSEFFRNKTNSKILKYKKKKSNTLCGNIPPTCANPDIFSRGEGGGVGWGSDG